VISRRATWVGCTACSIVVGALLVSAGQPLFAEDTWWHLAMGRAYLAQGPWLEVDPLLFTAQGPPAPASWLAALFLHVVESWAGFHALRLLHVTLVAGILYAAARALLRASGSLAFASAGTAMFAAMSGYRLFQLRPELLTLLFSIWLVSRIVDTGSESDGGRAPGRTIAWTAVLLCFWANVHAAFLLGPILLATAAAGLALALGVGERSSECHPDRLKILVAALALGLLATLVNPTGASPHLLYFVAGEETPALGGIRDEWARFPLWDLPRAHLPPSALSWGATWLLVLALPVTFFAALRKRARRDGRAGAALDPALLAIGAASLAAMLIAVRFGWMSIFVLLAIGHGMKQTGVFEREGNSAPIVMAAIASAIAIAFFPAGAWPMISRGVGLHSYDEPYPAAKHEAHAVWFLADVGARGRIFNDYQSGNFLGYWLAPQVATFVNGSLNVPRATLEDGAVIGRRGWESPETIEALLDRYAIDFFFATGVPIPPRANREIPVTTRHLERTEGWLQVFRNFDSAVYLRDHPRNRPNLERIARHYAEARVPFDPHGGGFDPHAVIQSNPRWAIDHGLIPRQWDEISERARASDPRTRFAARQRQAGLFALLGAYEEAARLDRETLSRNPRALLAARRLLFCLLQLGGSAQSEAAILADALAANVESTDEIAAALIGAAQAGPDLDPVDRRALASLLPMLTRAEASRLGAGRVPPAARS